MTRRSSDITPDSHFKTKLSSLVIAVVAIVGAVWHAGREFSALTAKIEEVQNFIRVGWDYQMEEDTWLQVALDNPTFKVPDIEKIRRRRADFLQKHARVFEASEGVVSTEKPEDIPIP